MRKIFNPEILLPPLLLEDDRLKAVKRALEHQLKLVSEATRECILLPRLDYLDEPVLDVLANQLHVDYYLPLEMDIDTKRAFIRQSILDHRIKGTPQAVERSMRRLYPDAAISEWFEYGGAPYYFRVSSDLSADDLDADRNTINKLHAAIEASKNARSWLEYIDFTVNYSDTVTLPTDTATLSVEYDAQDAYDYGRVDIRYDGAVCADGSNSYTGFEGVDFERVVFEVDALPADTVSVIDEPLLDITLANHDDTFDVPTEDADAGLEQRVVADGYYGYDGAVNADGLDTTEVVILDHDEIERWWSLHSELQDFSERCTCGASSYDWHRSRVRLGEDKFSILDPQLLTVQIRCSKCGYIIAEYIVPDTSWEVIYP